jgi:uncharacterized protein (TIGR02246 family)
MLVLIVALLAAPSGSMTALQSPAARAPQSDEAAIRDVVKKYVEAREHADPAAIGALFTGDADQLTSSGEWRKGREAVVRGTIESSATAAGTRTITIEMVRFPAPGVALADGRYEISGRNGSRLMWTSLLLTRASGEWRIAAIRNMLPAPPA